MANVLGSQAADGAREKVSDGVIKDLSERWKLMSKEDREAATEQGLVELAARQVNKKRGRQNTPLAIFNDTRATLASVQTTVSDTSSEASRGLIPYSSTTCTSERTLTSS